MKILQRERSEIRKDVKGEKLSGRKNYQLVLRYSRRTARDGFGTDGLFKANTTHSPFIIQYVSPPGC